MSQSLTDRNLKILQWNVRGIKNKLYELAHIANNFDIFIISETWLNLTNKVKLRGFDVVREDRLYAEGGGVAIFVRNGIKYSILKVDGMNLDIEVCGIEVSSSSGKICIISLYRSPSMTKFSKDEWCRFLNQFKDKNVLMGGDFNLPNDEIIPLVEAGNDLDLFLLNDDSPTYYNIYRDYSSVLDLTLASPVISVKSEWTVLDELWGSDHCPIKIFINLLPICSTKFRKRKKLYNNHTNWDVFSQRLETDIIPLMDLLQGNSNVDIQSLYSSFTALIESLVRDCSGSSSGARSVNSVKNMTTNNNYLIKPKRQSSGQPNSSCPWWDERCDKLINDRTKAYNKFKNQGNRENLDAYIREVARVRLELRKIKREKFDKFIESLRKDSNPTYVWKKIKAFQKSLSGSASPNCYNKYSYDAICNLIERLFPPWAASAPLPLPWQGKDELMDLPFVSEEIEAVFNNVNIKSSPGLDGIDYYVISHFAKSVKEFLLELYNKMMVNQQFPKEWSQYRMFFLPKDSEGKSYRPISMANCLCKVMERLIANRMNWFLEFYELLPESQFGFRAGRSSIDNLAILHSSIISSVKSDRVLNSVFLDIKSAYDRVIPDVLIQKLISIGLAPKMIGFIQNNINNREVFCEFDDINEVRHTSLGLPQGSVLSPLLYNIYVSDLEKCLHPNCNIVQFADDVAIFASAENTLVSASYINVTLKTIISKLQELGLEISNEKTKYCAFRRKRKKLGDLSKMIKIDDCYVNHTRNIKFLGLWFSADLSWEKQVNEVVKKCQCPLKIIACVAKTWKGADPRLIKIIYNALVRSRIDYGCFIVHDLTVNQSLKIDRLQFKALRLVAGLRNSTPINFILGEIKEPFIEARRRFLCKSYVCRVLSQSNHPIIGILDYLVLTFDAPSQNESLGAPLLLSIYRELSIHVIYIESNNKPLRFRHPWSSIALAPAVDLDSGILFNKEVDGQAQFLDIYKNSITESLTVFTDGSKMKGKEHSGFAFSIPELNVTMKFKSPEYAPIFTLEAMAILEALKWVLSKQYCNVSIYSDSKSVLKALAKISMNNTRSSYLIYEIKHLINLLSNRSACVKFFWIPAHCGISGNERADEAAKSAISEGIDTDLNLDARDFRGIWKEKQFSELFDFCRARGEHKAIFYMNNFFQESRKPWFDKLNLSRKCITSICRLRSGHSSLASSLAKLNIVDSPNCVVCNEEETANHILWDCPRTENLRKKLISDVVETFHTLPCPVELIIAVPNGDSLSPLIHFLTKCEIRI